MLHSERVTHVATLSCVLHPEHVTHMATLSRVLHPERVAHLATLICVLHSERVAHVVTLSCVLHPEHVAHVASLCCVLHSERVAHMATLCCVPHPERVTHVATLCCTGIESTYLEIRNLVDIRNTSNCEVGLRFETDVLNRERVFFTDLNGFQVSCLGGARAVCGDSNVVAPPSRPYVLPSALFVILLRPALSVSIDGAKRRQQ